MKQCAGEEKEEHARRSRKAGEDARRRAEEGQESMLGGEAMAAVGGD